MPFVTLRDGQPIHVRICGRGEPVLLLPALGMRSCCWLPFIWPFLHGFRFYMPDFRGSGPSSAAGLNQADIFQNNREDVQDIIAHFGLQGFLLVGYSLGASVAPQARRIKPPIYLSDCSNSWVQLSRRLAITDLVMVFPVLLAGGKPEDWRPLSGIPATISRSA